MLHNICNEGLPTDFLLIYYLHEQLKAVLALLTLFHFYYNKDRLVDIIFARLFVFSF